MSINSRIWEMNNHLLADYEVLTLAGADLTNVDKNILNLKPTWKERLLYFMNNGTDIVWNNWNKVSGTGTSLTLNNTEEAPMSLTYKGNTYQSGTPTPTSPIPVQVVSGDNSIGVCGKNLFDSDKFLTTTFTTGIYKYALANFKGNRTLYIKAQIKSGKTAISGLYLALSDDGNNPNSGTVKKFPIYNGSVTGAEARDFTGINDLYISYYPTTVTWQEISEVYDIWVSTTDTTYEPYQGSSYPISLGDIELCKIGTYQDKIFKNTPNTTDYDSNLEDNVWYLKKEIGKVVLDGSETWAEWTTNVFYSSIKGNIKKSLSNYFKFNEEKITALSLDNGEYCLNNSNIFLFKDTSSSTVADFKTWLSTHNTVVYYPLATPTYEYITDTTLLSQLEALKKSYDSQTNISQTNNDLPFELSVTALEVMS